MKLQNIRILTHLSTVKTQNYFKLFVQFEMSSYMTLKF
jgi:hypothetical protein